MPDDIGIEVHHPADGGQVTLTCSDEAFARVYAAVLAGAEPTAGDPADVRLIVVRRRPVPHTPTPWQNAVALVGCSTVVLTFLFVLVVGARTIGGWVW